MTERLVLRCGRLIDGTGREPVDDAWLTIADDRIEQVTTSPPPDVAGAEHLDATGLTVMPGLMDLHVHLIHGVTDPREPHILFGLLSSSSQLLTLWAARNARLSATVTECNP